MAFVLATRTAQGQDEKAGVKSLSIEEALARALSTSNSVAAAIANVDRARADVTHAQSDWWPQIFLSAAYERTLKSEFEDLFINSPGIGSSTTSAGNDFIDLPFGRKNIWHFTVNASVNLFAGGRTIAQTAAASSAQKSAELGLTSSRASVVLDLSTTYLDAVLAARLVTIAQSTLEQSQATLKDVRAQREAGQKPEFELLRAQVNFENQKPLLLQQEIARDFATARLAQLLHYPLDTKIELTTPIDEEHPRDLGPVVRSIAQLGEESPEQRLVVQQAEETVHIREASRRIAFAQHLPTVDLTTSYGLVNYPQNIYPNFDELKTNWTAGISLNIPLFTGFRITSEVLGAEADIANAQALQALVEERAELDEKNARDRLVNAKATYDATAGTVEVATRAYEIAETRYKEGVSTQLELLDARVALEQARVNRVRAIRDLQVARIQLGLLPYLPLVERPLLEAPTTGLTTGPTPGERR